MSDEPRVLAIPDLSLVVLVGASGSGKSTLAARLFLPTEVLSSDHMRRLVDDDETSLDATGDAFEALHYIAGLRLRRRRLAVVDATNVRRDDRAPLVELAKRHHALPVAIVLDLPPEVCLQRNLQREDRQTPERVVKRQHDALQRSLRSLKHEGFSRVHVIRSMAEADSVVVEREPLWPMRHRSDVGPFDIIGDVHGCADELRELLAALGWRQTDVGGWAHPEERRLVFAGDLVDRGPATVEAVRLAMDLCDAGLAYWVPGNHDVRLAKRLSGREIPLTHGLAESLASIEGLASPDREEFVARYLSHVDGLVSHLVLDDGRLVVAHAGMTAEMQGRASAEVRAFALYGSTTGELDEYGLPVRLDWAERYRGRVAVVYGHVAVVEPRWANNTIDIDTGCVFGGRLTALRWPEKDIVSVGAGRAYFEAVGGGRRPAAEPSPSLDGVLDLADVMGKRTVRTELVGRVSIPPAQAAAALEVISRFAVRPEWLVYLPPTMSPCETSERADYLEHPDEALAYYRDRGVADVVCEEKHMGSRAVVVVCRDESVAARRFGVGEGEVGECVTRSGRRMLDEPMRRRFLDRVREAVTESGLWDVLETDWLCLDCELLPWNAEGGELLRQQYAPVSVAGRASCAGAERMLARAVTRGLPVEELRARVAGTLGNLESYTLAYRRYCWPVSDLEDLRLAPFHVLASEGAVHHTRDHAWHMEVVARLAAADPQFALCTAWRQVDLRDADAVARAVAWWEELTSAGGEGFVVKPLSFVGRQDTRLLQPAVKCRGREYLRIIYGPDYTREDHLARLRERGLQRKRTLALNEFALGLEALRRFVLGEPLHRVHECVFALLALECEPIDPRL